MATTQQLEYLIKVNDRDLTELKKRVKETNQTLEQGEQSGSKFSGALGKVGKGALVAGGILGGVLAIGAKAGFGEFLEGEKIAAQTEAVLKSTGNSAKVTAKEVEKLAGAISRKSGIDDEAIQKGQNLLLTFTGIKNEAGKGNDIFNQTTQIMTDMSVAMGTEVSAGAIQLGKALNDPIKGVGALSRVGVTFTEQQKEQIKAMQEAGNTAGAQKVILAELQKEFGGSAEAAGKTFGGQLSILKNMLEGVAGEIVGKLVPHLMTFVGFITNSVVPWIKNFKENLTGGGEGGLKGAFSSVGDFIQDVWLPVVRGIAGVFRSMFDAVIRVFNENKTELKTIVSGIMSVIEGIYWVLEKIVLPLLKEFFADDGPFDKIFGLAIAIVSGLIKTITKIVTGVSSAIQAVKKWWNGEGQEMWNSVWSAIRKPVDAITDAIGAIVDKVEWLIENLGKLKGKIPFIGGGPSNPNMTAPEMPPYIHQGGINLLGASPVMSPFAASAAGYGLSVTSGLRVGDPGDHGKGKALDVSNTYFSDPDGTPEMHRYFMSLLGNRAVRQAFYDPLGSIFDGVWNSYREGGHSNHVHVATYHKGGIVPGSGEVPAILKGGEGVFTREQMRSLGPGGTTTVNVYVEGSVTAAQDLAEEIRGYLRQTGERNLNVGLA